MKLIYCPRCKSILSLSMKQKYCDCRGGGGVYRNQIEADIWGTAVPLGISNFSFEFALEARPTRGKGAEFTAFVIPKECNTITEG